MDDITLPPPSIHVMGLGALWDEDAVRAAVLADRRCRSRSSESEQQAMLPSTDEPQADRQRGEPPPCDPTATQCPRCNNPNGPKLGPCEWEQGDK